MNNLAKYIENRSKKNKNLKQKINVEYENLKNENVIKKIKKQITIRINIDTIKYFKKLAKEVGIPYQNLMNLYLNDCIEHKKKIKIKM